MATFPPPAPLTPGTPFDPTALPAEPTLTTPEVPPVVGVGSPWAPANGENRDRILDWWRSWWVNVHFPWVTSITEWWAAQWLALSNYINTWAADTDTNLNAWITDVGAYVSTYAVNGHSWWVTDTVLATSGTTTATIPTAAPPIRQLIVGDLVSDTSAVSSYGVITAVLTDTTATVQYIGSLQGVPGPNTIPTDTAVAGLVPGPSLTNTALDGRYMHLGQTVYVGDYGAVADGVTDDTAAINAAMIAAKALSAATAKPITVLAMAGTHLVNHFEHPTTAGHYAAVQIPSGVTFQGQGRGATTIKLAPNQAQAGRMLINTALLGGDKNITIMDMTLDGDGATQTQLTQGILFLRATDLSITRVTVQDVFGNANFPPGETFLYSTDSCVRVTYTDCTALGLNGTQGSGFADNAGTHITYQGCNAYNMSAGMGFASWTGASISYTGCRAVLCGSHGFNVEFGQDITYAGCIAGGTASDLAAGYFYTNTQTLGNGSSGFVINATKNAMITGCISRLNDTGITVTPTGAVTSSAIISGCSITDNLIIGITFGDAVSAAASSLSQDSIVSGSPAIISVPPLGNTPINNPIKPTLTNGIAIPNPYPFPVNVTLDGGTINYVAIQGANIGIQRSFHVPRGNTVLVSYGTIPAWHWVRG